MDKQEIEKNINFLKDQGWRNVKQEGNNIVISCKGYKIFLPVNSEDNFYCALIRGWDDASDELEETHKKKMVGIIEDIEKTMTAYITPYRKKDKNGTILQTGDVIRTENGLFAITATPGDVSYDELSYSMRAIDGAGTLDESEPIIFLDDLEFEIVDGVNKEQLAKIFQEAKDSADALADNTDKLIDDGKEYNKDVKILNATIKFYEEVLDRIKG